jgi:hypothetical protein
MESDDDIVVEFPEWPGGLRDFAIIPGAQSAGFYILLVINTKSPTRKQWGLTGTEGSNPVHSASQSVYPVSLRD